MSVRLLEEAASEDVPAFRRAWRAFLRLGNLLQFTPLVELVTTQGLEQVRYGALLDEWLDIDVIPATPPAGLECDELEALVAVTDPAVTPVLFAVAGAGGSLPDAGGAALHQEALVELRREKAALNELVRHIHQRHVLNFFTDEGLLPNYAFPESGVVLQSVIYRRREGETDPEKRFDVRTYEYQRPAAVAISELAPANSFYAEGRKLVIDQVSLDLSRLESWRFCNACSHMALEGAGEAHAACPRCGSPLWADEGQRRQMLRLRQVIATSSEEASRAYDEADDREPEFYQKNLFARRTGRIR